MPMRGQLNGTNLKEEVGDNFMSDYATYTNYAKKTIKELEKLNVLKQSFKGKKLAEKIREEGLKLITKSAVDSVLHGLGESNNFSNLNPQQKKIAEKLVSLRDDALTYKSSSIQGVLEKLTKKQWLDSQSTGLGDESHPVNHNNPHVNKLQSENAEMAQSDLTKIIDYSEKLQSMFNVNDNLEDWVKAKLNHACDYVATVRDYLKFYNEEKQKGTQNIDEVWSNKYKKSINCSNPKGFSQKAHCRARKLRQAGKHTKSKPVKECYKEAIQELLKEQNSSMAMGALKQLNSDAKELESMLQPNTQLEDWVKAKLNLAGEYLDDVYHHLDHFGPQGRKLDEILNELDYEGGVGFHEFAMFYQKASQDEIEQMEDCLKGENKECVKDLITKVTGMSMAKIQEGYYEDKAKEQQRRMFRFGTTMSPEKKYWVTPEGNVVEAGYSHEEWIRNNVPDLKGSNLIQTYDNAIRKGYIRVILDLNHGFLTLSNMENYDFSMNGEPNKNIPAVKPTVLDAIKNFVKEKNVSMVATGKGKLIKDLSVDESKLTEGWKDILAAGALGLGALTTNVDASKLPQSAPVVQTAVKDSESSLLNKKTSDYIGHWEGKRNAVYNDTEGKPTIGIGHYLNNSQQDRQLFKSLFGSSVDYDKVLNGQQKLTDEQIEKLFNVDVKIKEKLASSKISNFNSLPNSVKNAVINALYRGDLGPKTIALMNSGNWGAASKEYLNHKNAKSGPEQIKRRMKTNAMAFAQYAKSKG